MFLFAGNAPVMLNAGLTSVFQHLAVFTGKYTLQKLNIIGGQILK
jgi:hypothetical protein